MLEIGVPSASSSISIFRISVIGQLGTIRNIYLSGHSRDNASIRTSSILYIYLEPRLISRTPSEASSLCYLKRVASQSVSAFRAAWESPMVARSKSTRFNGPCMLISDISVNVLSGKSCVGG
jgi:hypothetical protein